MMPSARKSERRWIIRRTIVWQIIGVLSGAIGSVLLGCLLGLLEPSGSPLEAIATGAIVHFGIYLSSFFIWLPITLALIAGSTFIFSRQSRLADRTFAILAILTVVVALVAVIVRFSIVPFSFPLLFAFIWLTLVPPTLVVDLADHREVETD